MNNQPESNSKNAMSLHCHVALMTVAPGLFPASFYVESIKRLTDLDEKVSTQANLQLMQDQDVRVGRLIIHPDWHKMMIATGRLEEEYRGGHITNMIDIIRLSNACITEGYGSPALVNILLGKLTD